MVHGLLFLTEYNTAGPYLTYQGHGATSDTSLRCKLGVFLCLHPEWTAICIVYSLAKVPRAIALLFGTHGNLLRSVRVHGKTSGAQSMLMPLLLLLLGGNNWR